MFFAGRSEPNFKALCWDPLLQPVADLGRRKRPNLRRLIVSNVFMCFILVVSLDIRQLSCPDSHNATLRCETSSLSDKHKLSTGGFSAVCSGPAWTDLLYKESDPHKEKMIHMVSEGPTRTTKPKNTLTRGIRACLYLHSTHTFTTSSTQKYTGMRVFNYMQLHTMNKKTVLSKVSIGSIKAAHTKSARIDRLVN
jgi:hypothetical protein